MSAAPPPAVPEWTLADRLRKARELAGYSQAELATATGISRQSINRYETGRSVPDRPKLLAWATACHVEYEWLTGADPGAPSPSIDRDRLRTAYSLLGRRRTA